MKHMPKILNFLVFMILLGWIFAHTTYLFRNTSYDRNHVNGIRNEENLDVVCIGGSSTFVYWEPYLAWKEYGMTSYNLATNSAMPAVVNGYTRYLLQMQNPDLVVIDMRPFVGERGGIFEAAVRNMTDSLPLSPVRFQIMTNILKYYDAFEDDSVDIASYYFDIAKYHGNYERLGSETNWQYINNDYTSEYNGFEFIENPCHAIVEEPVDFKTKERKELDPDKEAYLRELLEYLNEKDVDALFVASPYRLSQDNEMQFNTIGDIVSSYGYQFLNTNGYYQEMRIDFKKDFYDGAHMNVYGAEKYTRFAADYIKENYQIDDHRINVDQDEKMKAWDQAYLAAKEQEEYVKKLIDQQVFSKKEANDAGHALAEIDHDFWKWQDKAVNENYTVFVLSKGDIPDVGMIHMPWNLSGQDSDVIRIYTGSTMVYESDAALDSAYSGTAGTSGKGYSINCGAKSELIVDGRQYEIKEDGMYILVFDNNYNEVLDAVRISDNDKGGYVLKHMN